VLSIVMQFSGRICLVALAFVTGGYGFAQVPTVPPQQDFVGQPSSGTNPVTAGERLKWFTRSTVGPPDLAGGLVSAGWGTLFNRPHEYGPHWEGFGDRYGMRLTGVVASNAAEAGLGAIWGEDPRYHRAAQGTSFGKRVGRVVKWTVLAPGDDGELRPAWARYAAISGTNFLSNTWRERSEADTSHALERTLYGFAGRLAGNAWEEFWPSVKRKLFHRDRAPDSEAVPQPR
jgi:hypothetical protein